MSPRTLRLAALAGACALLALPSLLGCSKKAGGVLLPNRPPSVELTNAPSAPDTSNPYFYAYRINWSGDDPDGRIDHYEYTIDPTVTDSVWVKTTKNEEILFFRCTHPDRIKGLNPPTASDFHTFVIKAVDNDGAESARKWRSFYSFTIAPTVAIRNPIPSKLLRAQVPPSLRIEWDGQDVDGQFTQKPVKYKFKMMDLGDPRTQFFLTDLDSLRRREAATNWAGWDSTTADTQFVQFTNLTPGNSYLFLLIGFDEAGAYSPVFTLNSNCLQFTAGLAASNGPIIHIFDQYIDFAYASGGYTTDPLREIVVEVPTKRPIEVFWEAFPSQGSHIQYFRWMVDGNINDQTPRTDEREDYIHWTQPDPTMPNGVTLRPFTDGIHRFYLECADNNGQKSLGILRLTAVTPTFNRTLLVIDDTRLEVDKFLGDRTRQTPDNYTLPWPSRTELDTFLFAKGGYPWRATKNPTSGVLSTPGLFAGYDFDTLGTRLGLENPARGVLLSIIGRYKNLVWLVDDKGAQIQPSEALSPTNPTTALVSMSGPGRPSTLAAYTQLGGRVWLAGGGAGYASLQLFDKRGNNTGQTTVFSSAVQFGELAPSRIMFDGAHWQSSMAVTKSLITTNRWQHVVRFNTPTGQLDSNLVVGAVPWSHYDRFSGTTLSSPDYTKLPFQMRTKADAGDLVPPTRTAAQSSSFYPSSYPCEYLLEGNSIIEVVGSHEQPVLDTLFEARGTVLLTPQTPEHPAATMTYYHGNGANRFVFSGFPPWSYARADCMALVDFVLQDIWGLPRQPIDRGSITPSLQGPGIRPFRTARPPQPTISARVPKGPTRE